MKTTNKFWIDKFEEFIKPICQSVEFYDMPYDPLDLIFELKLNFEGPLKQTELCINWIQVIKDTAKFINWDKYLERFLLGMAIILCVMNYYIGKNFL